MPQDRVRGGRVARGAGDHHEARIRGALSEPGRTKDVRKIAEEFGVSPSTVQAISRPLGTSAAAA
jgi:hypothetical protein